MAEKQLQTLNERIAEKVGENLIDLIPADQWQEIVDQQVVIFKRDTAPKIIKKELDKAYREKIVGAVIKLTSQDGWDYQTNLAIHSELEKFIGQSAGVIVGAMLTPSMATVLNDLRTQLEYQV